jgi:hypothetical protein
MKKLTKQTKINEIIDNDKFLSLFDAELVEYIFKTTKEKYEKYRALKFLYLRDIFTFDKFKKKYSYENLFRIWKHSSFGWDESLSNYMRGNGFRGKKRPKHSEIMKIKMKGIDRGDSFREKKKIQNSSINFKIKFLINKGYNLDDKNEEEIKKIYTKFISDLRKSDKYKIKKVYNFLKTTKYLDYEMFINFKKKYVNTEINDDNITTIYHEMMSIISHISMEKNENMGKTKFFKRGFKKVNFCKNKTIIKYRSSWELKSIEFLEENQISYEYEPFYIEKEDGTFYLPDFLIDYNGDKILLEIKGFIRGDKGNLNEELKIKSAKKFCDEKSFKFIYLTKFLTNINDIIK